FFDAMTNLENVHLGERGDDFVSLVDVHWGGVDLSVFPWWRVNMLGDERRLHQQRDHDGKKKIKEKRADEYRAAIRANVQLAAALRDLGIDEQAGRFSYRAQILQRGEMAHLAFHGKRSVWRRM